MRFRSGSGRRRALSTKDGDHQAVDDDRVTVQFGSVDVTLGRSCNASVVGDVTDGHLAGLAPYCNELYVDERTAEVFRRAHARSPALSSLLDGSFAGKR